MTVKIPCSIYRGGTSKPIFFWEEDLPKDPALRERVILAAFGSPDLRQIDGLGGADPLTSKVALIGPPTVAGTDVNYTFGYVGISSAHVDWRGNCGNTSAAVGPYAIEKKLVAVTEPLTRVRIYNTNTKKVIVAEVPVTNGEVVTEGDFVVDGVPGSGAKVLLDFVNAGGAVTGALLPTGKVREEIPLPKGQYLTVSIVDAANPFVFVRSDELGLKGDEPIEQFSSDPELLTTCEQIRSLVAERLGLVSEWREATTKSPAVPKIALISPPRPYLTLRRQRVEASRIDFIARMMALQKPHKAYAVTGAICAGAAAKIEGTIVHEIYREGRRDALSEIRIGHPSGVIAVEVELVHTEKGIELRRGAVARTARRIMDGFVYLPESVFRP